MEPNIVFSHVTKTYKGGVTALEDVSFSVGSGVFGLLGHNGAGKSTLMKALVTVEPPTSGAIQVCGFDTARQGREVRQRLGYLPQELPMYPSLSVRDFLRYMGELKGLRDKTQVEQVLLQVEMQDFARRKIGQLSGGMRRRVGIAQALLGEPPILVVDEPTAGLDPVGVASILGNIHDYHTAKNATIIIVSHSMEEVARTVDRLVVINDGRIPFSGAPREVFAHGDELEAMGLGVPAMTRVFHRLRAMGVDIDPSVYTTEHARDAVLAKLARAGQQKQSASGERGAV